MIKIIGDVHGKTGDYKRLVRSMEPGQRSVQIGDMGVGFSGVIIHDMSQDHKWFRGNHDNPEKCRRHPNYLGDWGYLPEDKLFWLAGAFSIDRIYRTPGVTWWEDEELSYLELQKAIGYYEAVKPKYVLSHEAPSEVAKRLLLDLQGPYFASKLACSMSRTAEALQRMFDLHKPEEWIFGHYHVDKQLEWHGTLFTCVAELSTYDLRADAKNDGSRDPERVSPAE